jgi:hypothetical protein
MINYLALLTALILSGVSGFYSVYGLTALFAGAFYPIIFMGGALEIGKLVTASWLYNNWNVCPRLLKYYLTIIVITLMFISSMGTFGFLSKAHIDQTLNMSSGSTEQLQIVNQKIDFEKQNINDIDKQLGQIDNAVNKITEKGRGESSLRAADSQKKNRDQLLKKKEDEVKKISELTLEKVKIESAVRKIEAEVGPVKYIADIIYGEADNNQLEKAVRFVIILIVLVFDPLAVSLLMAANIGIKSRKFNLTSGKKHSILEIDESVFKRKE